MDSTPRRCGARSRRRRRTWTGCRRAACRRPSRPRATSVAANGIGHSDNCFATFNACGFGCHVRTITFDDGSTLLIRVEDQPTGFAFTSPGNSGSNGYIGFPGQDGNPQFLEVKETILGGTGRFAGASGSGTGTVKLHG